MSEASGGNEDKPKGFKIDKQEQGKRHSYAQMHMSTCTCEESCAPTHTPSCARHTHARTHRTRSQAVIEKVEEWEKEEVQLKYRHKKKEQHQEWREEGGPPKSFAALTRCPCCFEWDPFPLHHLPVTLA